MARHDGLEAARAIAMMLVVATHAAISYMVTPVGWAVQDTSQHLAVDLYVWVVRAFVMPTFFWLSGYFARAVLTAGLRTYLRHRLTRIALPFAIALVPCSLAISALWDWGHDLTGGNSAVAPHAPAFQSSGLPIMLAHLWYLYYLLWFSAVALAVATAARGLRIPTFAQALGPPLLVIGSLAATRSLHPDTPLSFVPDLPIAAFNGGFFLWGWLVHRTPGALELHSTRVWQLVAVAPGLLLVAGLALHGAIRHATPPPIYAIVASGLFSLVLVAAFLGLCVRYGRRPHPALQLASRASYWFYVAHLPIVVLLQIAFALLPLPGVIEYAAIVATTTVVCLGLYIAAGRLRRML